MFCLGLFKTKMCVFGSGFGGSSKKIVFNLKEKYNVQTIGPFNLCTKKIEKLEQIMNKHTKSH